MRIRVLLVEDQPSNAELVREMLSVDMTSSFEFTDAWCLRDALEKLGRASFDVVLLDLGLPDSDGPEAIREIHAFAPDAPIIVLTGQDDEKIATEALREGATGYLRKHEMTAELLALLS